MAIYISAQDELHTDYQGVSLECPHCRTTTHLTAVAVPRFEDTSRRRPRHVGIVFRCDACAEPVFLKFATRAFTPQRIELAPQFLTIERARANFPVVHLPEEAQPLFQEALACHAAGLYVAFGALCRRTAQALFHALGERGKLEIYDILQGTRELAELDEDTFVAVRTVLFGNDADPWPNHPPLDALRAGVLLEVMCDVLHQAFVRKARLRQALASRKRITPIQAAS